MSPRSATSQALVRMTNTERGRVLSHHASMTAAATRIEPGNAEQVGALPRQGEKWQKEAWVYRREVPQVQFVMGYTGNSLSRLRLYPGVVVDPEDAPVPVMEAVDAGEIPEQLAVDAIDASARVFGGREGQAGLLYQWGVCLSTSGDSYLIGEEDPDDPEDEWWHVVSEQAITKQNGRLAIKDRTSGKPRELSDDAVVIRIYQRDSEYPSQAWSSMRAILGTCEELLIFNRQFRAVGKSKASAGFVLLPNGLDLPPVDPNKQGEPTSLEEAIAKMMVTPITDDSAVAAVAPRTLRGARDDLKEVRHVTFERKIDEQAIPRIDALIKWLAQGLDIPVEVLLGIGDVTHWNAWLIEDAGYKSYLEPKATIPAMGLTSSYLKPDMLLRGHDRDLVRRLAYGVDASQLVVRPNRTQDAKDLYDRFELSGEALRRHTGVAESDAPEDDEIQRRLQWSRPKGAVNAPRPEPLPAGEGDDPTPATTPDEPGDGSDTQNAVTGRRLALVASTSTREAGRRLAAIDARLRDRLTGATSQAMTDALRRAGSNLRGRVSGNAVLRGMVKGQPPATVARILGRERVEKLATADELVGDAFESVGDDFVSWTDTAFSQTEAIIRDLADDPDEADAAVERFRQGRDDNKISARTVLITGLITLASKRLFEVEQAPTQGEFDASLAVSPGLIRQAMAVMGGSLLTGPPSPGPLDRGDLGIAGGVATGQDLVDSLPEIGLTVGEWEWTVGDPARPFEPHADLAGLTFSDWNDDLLVNSESWPEFPYYFPGDHLGCQCDTTPTIEEES